MVVARSPVALAGSLMAAASPFRVPSPVSSWTGEPSNRLRTTLVDAPVTWSARAAACAKPSWWVRATEVTVTENRAGEAVELAETETALLVDDAVTGCHEEAAARAPALLPTRAASVLRAWRLVTRLCSVWT